MNRLSETTQDANFNFKESLLRVKNELKKGMTFFAMT
jgi:hypothetical protein